jgi:hypothetical protein
MNANHKDLRDKCIADRRASLLSYYKFQNAEKTFDSNPSPENFAEYKACCNDFTESLAACMLSTQAIINYIDSQ